nr:hypothetical protein BgiMline_025985 [Biomphalaria glabrata]
MAAQVSRNCKTVNIREFRIATTTTTIESVASKITELPNTDSETNVTPGPSAKKIKMQSNILPEERNLNNTNSFILMDTSILFAFLSATVACDVCSQFTLSVELDDERRSGFAHEIILRCSNCNEWETRFKTSREDCGHKEMNLRMVSFARAIGRGYNALDMFTLYLNSPPPMTRNNYKKMFTLLKLVKR